METYIVHRHVSWSWNSTSSLQKVPLAGHVFTLFSHVSFGGEVLPPLNSNSLCRPMLTLGLCCWLLSPATDTTSLLAPSPAPTWTVKDSSMFCSCALESLIYMHRLLKGLIWMCQSSQGHPRMAIPTVGKMSCLGDVSWSARALGNSGTAVQQQEGLAVHTSWAADLLWSWSYLHYAASSCYAGDYCMNLRAGAGEG